MPLYTELLNQKRLQVARELAPEATVIAFLHNPNNPNFASEVVDEAARAIGRQVRILTAGSAQQFEGGFVTLVQEGIGALAVSDESVFIGGRGGRRRSCCRLSSRRRGSVIKNAPINVALARGRIIFMPFS